MKMGKSRETMYSLGNGNFTGDNILCSCSFYDVTPNLKMKNIVQLKKQQCGNVRDQKWEKIPLGGENAINADGRRRSRCGGRKTITRVAEIGRTGREASMFVLFDLAVVALFKDFYSGVASSVETPNEKEFERHFLN